MHESDFEPVAPPRKKKPVRENKVEKYHSSGVKHRGGRSLKFVSPGTVGVPDRIDIFPIPPEHRATVAKYVRFTEVKAPGKSPRPEQLREHTRLRAFGFEVDVVDSIEKDLFK